MRRWGAAPASTSGTLALSACRGACVCHPARCALSLSGRLLPPARGPPAACLRACPQNMADSCLAFYRDSAGGTDTTDFFDWVNNNCNGDSGE